MSSLARTEPFQHELLVDTALHGILELEALSRWRGILVRTCRGTTSRLTVTD